MGSGSSVGISRPMHGFCLDFKGLGRVGFENFKISATYGMQTDKLSA